MLRPIQYLLYVFSLPLALSLLTWVVGRAGGERESLVAVLGPFMAMMLPLVICQAALAGLLVKAPSLKRLFALSMVVAMVCGLIGVLLSLVSRSSASLGFLFDNPLLWLAAPVFILFVTQRQQEKESRHERQEESGDATNRSKGATPASPSRPWYHRDIALLAVPLSYGVLLDPLGVFNYLDGLANRALLGYAFFAFFFLAPVALFCVIVELGRMVIVWPRRLHVWRRLVLCWAAAAGAVVICLVLPLSGVRAKPWEMTTRGFRRNMQVRADIRGIQAWLATLDPNDCEGQPLGVRVAEGVAILHPPKYVPPPDSIRRLRPRYTKLMLDDDGRPLIRLTWGGGLMGHWGLVVGSEKMETPPVQKEEYGSGVTGQVSYHNDEYRLSLAAGAYVWDGME